MEENKNSDFKNKSNSVENLNIRSQNFRPSLSNSNSRPGPSNSNSRPGPSNINSRPPAASNNWQERDRKLPKKRSQSENDEWGRDNKLNKIEIPEKVKSEGKSENGVNERANENCNDNPLINLRDIALASQQIAMATMSQQSMGVGIPQQSQQRIMQPTTIPYQNYGFNAAENYHIDPTQGAYGLPFGPVMQVGPNWTINHPMPSAVNSVASTSGIGMSSGMEMVSNSSGNNMGAYPYMSMGNADPSLYSMMPNMQMFNPYPVVNNQDTTVPIFNNLEPIIINRAVLTPPLPGETRTRRPKPPGCRTVFIGNLPEKITEEIIREAFKICGPISVIRMSTKNFCHIRFGNMESVDQALLLSGFRIRIDDSEEAAYNSRMHVDYASARDDQHDLECLERARLREERHRQQEAFRPPSPPAIPDFSDHEDYCLTDRLHNKETFREGLQVLMTWLERGECNKKNSGNFYSFIETSYNHVKRLRKEKSRLIEEANKANENLMNKNRSIESEVNEIEKVFVAARTQKVWDQFTRSQRKKMEEMQNDTQDLKRTNSEDLVVEREEEEMEMSDTEDKNDNEDGDVLQEGIAEELNGLREELENANLTIEDFKCKNAELNDENIRLRFELEESKRNEKTVEISLISSIEHTSSKDSATQCSPIRKDVSENEHLLNSLVSIFLQVHPFGASIDYICSYLVKMVPSVNARDVESLLRRFPSLFKEVSTGIGATLEKKWIYVGFNSSWIK